MPLNVPGRTSSMSEPTPTTRSRSNSKASRDESYHPFNKRTILAFISLGLSIIAVTLTVSSYQDPFWHENKTFTNESLTTVEPDETTTLASTTSNNNPKKALDTFALGSIAVGVTFVFGFTVLEVLRIAGSNHWILGTKVVIGILIFCGGISKLISAGQVMNYKKDAKLPSMPGRLDQIDYEEGESFSAGILVLLNGLFIIAAEVLTTFEFSCRRLD